MSVPYENFRFPPLHHDDFAICVIPVLIAVIVTTILSSSSAIPHELVSMIVGGGLGIIIAYVPLFERMATKFWSPYDVLCTLQPILMIKMIYSIDTFIFMKSLSQIVLISTVGLTGFIIIFGFFLMILTSHEANLINVIIAGSVLAPIDIPDLILELESVKNLEVLMDGESTFGTAICLITFDLCVGGYAGIITKWYQVVCFYLRYIIISSAVGTLFGKITAFVFRCLYNDTMNAVVALLASSYMVYFMCEHFFFCSGTIGCFIIVFCVSLERARLGSDVDLEIQRFLNICYFNSELLSTIVLSACVMVRVIPYFKDFQFPLALGVYIIGNVVRFLTLICLAPILSRIGYGFDFTGMLAIFWAAKKGPLQIVTTIALSHHSIIDAIGPELLCFTLVYLILMYLVNGTTLKFILQKFGLIVFSEARKNNINNCFKFIHDRRHRLVSTMKMNRFYSDSNWPLIQEATILYNPFKTETVGEADLDLSGQRTTYCSSCVKNVPITPTKKDYMEMKNEVLRKVLKAKRVSYVRQFESGMLEQGELRALLDAIEIANGTQDLVIKLDDLFCLFEDTQFIVKLKRYLVSYKMSEYSGIPRNKFKRQLYTLALSRWYEFSYYTIIILNIVSVIIELVLLFLNIVDYNILILCINTVFYCLYLNDFFIKWIGFSKYDLIGGIVTYFSILWNKLDFCMLSWGFIDIIVTNTIYALGGNSLGSSYDTTLKLFGFFRILRIVRVSKLISESIYLRILNYCDNKIDMRVTYAFTIGKALVMAYDEVIELLPKIAMFNKIRDSVKEQLYTDKLAVSKELGIMTKHRPWISTSIKTKQAMLCTLTYIRSNIYELKSAGIVDLFEYEKLLKSVNDRLKIVSRLKSLPAVHPKSIFFEIPWIYKDENIMDFLYQNGKSKIFDAGDIIFNTGELVEGVYILVAGLFKMEYTPTEDIDEMVKNYGVLPVKEFFRNVEFTEYQQEFIFIGNSIGEMGVLTGRVSSCTIISDTPSRAFIIPMEVMKEAMNRSCDPINGLTCKLWKTIAWNMVMNIIASTPNYQSSSQEQLNFIIDRAIVPNLSCYKILVLSELIEYIILIEGLVVDYNTRDIYTAPCYIPRLVSKIILPISSNIHLNVEVKAILMLIPVKGVNVYDIMAEEQNISELVPNPSPSCLVRAQSQTKKTSSQKSKRIQSGMKVGSIANTKFYGGMSDSDEKTGSPN